MPSQSSSLPPERARVDALVRETRGIKATDLLARHAVPFRPYPGARGDVAGLDLLQRSALELTADELTVLRAQGFVVTRRQPFPSFLYGYQSIYGQDLPVYVSADSILNAVHRSFEAVLASVETEVLAPELRSLLERMHRGLAEGRADRYGSRVRADADLFLTVALRLLADPYDDTVPPVPPVAGAKPEQVAQFVARAREAGAPTDVELFGVRRRVDFSQFRPRGHYEEMGPDGQAYFQAMMWLGRLELRVVETRADGSQLFHRRQLEGALALRALLDEEARTLLSRIDRRLEVFAGPRDDLALEQLDTLAKHLGLDEPGALTRATDTTLAAEALRLAEGLGRVSSQIVFSDGTGRTLPPGASFLLLGQRRSPDAEVLSNVVFDRAGGGTVKRYLPDPLDVAFAALGNDQAAALLAPELERHPYAPDLERMRVLLDDAAAREPAKARSLRDAWLLALRALSPGPQTTGLPPAARSEAWGRRLLSTQLASWAELRHDTVLYDKQSYSGGELCEYPDGYVDPYPEFYAAVRRWAQLVATALAGSEGRHGRYFLERVHAWQGKFDGALATLEEMAVLERQGKPFRPEHLEFLNRSVVVKDRTEGMCGSRPHPQGWFADLYFDPADAVEFAPVVCDVHTQPTDGNGTQVGRVLHVATGAPRLLAVLIDTSSGPHVYVGLASAYHERITERFQRASDRAWANAYWTSPPADPPWTSGVVVGASEPPAPWRTRPAAPADPPPWHRPGRSSGSDPR